MLPCFSLKEAKTFSRKLHYCHILVSKITLSSNTEDKLELGSREKGASWRHGDYLYIHCSLYKGVMICVMLTDVDGQELETP